MPAPIPCLGHASITNAVMALISEGLSSGEILRRVNVALGRDPGDRRANNLVYSLCSTGGPRRKVLSSVSFALEREDMRLLEAAARRRGCYVRHVARRLIETAVRDDLIDAILDDTDAKERPAA